MKEKLINVDTRDYEEAEMMLEEVKATLSEEQVKLLDRYISDHAFLLITGTDVSKDQAMEIILRTDKFFTSDGLNGNNREFEKEVCKLFGMYHWDDCQAAFDRTKSLKESQEMLAHNREIHEAMGGLKIKHFQCQWISCWNVGGPSGFVKPNGEIFKSVEVVQTPNAEKAYLELLVIAANFPFLEMEVTFLNMNQEGEMKASVSFLVKDGDVEIVDPKLRDIHEEKQGASISQLAVKDENQLEKDLLRIINDSTLKGGRTKENAIPLKDMQMHLMRSGMLKAVRAVS